VPERRAAGAVDDRAVQGHEVLDELPAVLVVDERRRPGPGRRVVRLGAIALDAALHRGRIAVLAVADQPHQVLGAPAVDPAARERAHAVEPERGRIAVRHGRADVAERHVGEADGQREHLDAALVGNAPQRTVRLRARAARVRVRGPRDHALDRARAEQASAERRCAREERPPVETGMHRGSFRTDRLATDATPGPPWVNSPSGGARPPVRCPNAHTTPLWA
jgi:hypothetical protein